MKELFESLKHVDLKSNKLILLDTCFIVHTFEHNKLKELNELIDTNKVAITSFNLEELDHIKHKINDKTRQHIHKFFHKKPELLVLDVPVHPGNREAEMKFMNDIDPYLFQDVRDYSDGVLLAAAIKTRSKILSKDKHDVFTVNLKNYLDRYGVDVFKDFHTLM